MLWIDQSEGAKFWLRILNELKNQGLQDALVAAVDGLCGFPEAIAAVYPKAEVQRCIVDMVRNSLKFMPFKDRKAIATDLKKIYSAASEGTDAILQVPAGDPEGDLHDQCNRIA